MGATRVTGMVVAVGLPIVKSAIAGAGIDPNNRAEPRLEYCAHLPTAPFPHLGFLKVLDDFNLDLG